MSASAPASMAMTKGSPSGGVLVAYAVFLGFAAGVYHFIADGEFSSILTMSVMFQCGAFVTLALQVITSGSIVGISAHSLILEAAALCCRLSSTIWLDGYLPNDASGDWFYQAMDICSFFVVIWLLREVLVIRRSSYQADDDTAPHLIKVVLVCIVMAALLHGDMDDFPLFDFLWMLGLFFGVVAVLPQLWLSTRAGGKMDSLTSHYIAMMAMARVLSGTFMWYAREDVTCAPYVIGINHAIWAILFTHLLHLFLLGDFACIYVRTMITQGMQAPVDLNDLVFEV